MLSDSNTNFRASVSTRWAVIGMQTFARVCPDPLARRARCFFREVLEVIEVGGERSGHPQPGSAVRTFRSTGPSLHPG